MKTGNYLRSKIDISPISHLHAWLSYFYFLFLQFPLCSLSISSKNEIRMLIEILIIRPTPSYRNKNSHPRSTSKDERNPSEKPYLPFTNNKSMSKKHFPTNAIQAKGLVWELLQRVEIFLAHSVKQNKEMGKNKQKCMSACIQVLFHLGPSPARFTSYKFHVPHTGRECCSQGVDFTLKNGYSLLFFIDFVVYYRRAKLLTVCCRLA